MVIFNLKLIFCLILIGSMGCCVPIQDLLQISDILINIPSINNQIGKNNYINKTIETKVSTKTTKFISTKSFSIMNNQLILF